MQDPLLRRASIGLAVGASVSIAVGVLAATVRYEPYGVPESKRAAYKQMMAQIRQQAVLTEQPMAAAGPVAVTEETEHDFGFMDPLTEASHEFRVRNEGTAPLSLIAGDTSCKCTLSSVASRIVRPGEATTVTLAWNSGRTREFYRQYAVIRTNDPRRPEIELGVRGKVRREFAASAQEVAFPDIEPGEPAERKIAVFSQVWAHLELEAITTDVDDLTWTIEPLTPLQLEELHAQSGFAVAIRVSGDRPSGYFTGILRITLRPKADPRVAEPPDSATGGDALAEVDSAKPVALEGELQRANIEVSVRGKVLLPVSLYGPAVHAVDGIRIGAVPIGEAKTTKVLVKVRGSRQPAYLRVGSLTPDFLQATISKTSKAGFYELVVEVPAGAPQRSFSGELAGEMILECDLLEGGKMHVGIDGDTLGNPPLGQRHLQATLQKLTGR